MTPDGRDPVELAAELGDPAGWLVALDFDGTLSELVDHPDDAVPVAGALEAATSLARRTRVAIVSGRGLDDLAPRVAGLAATLVGGHGAEVREPDGAVRHLIDPGEVAHTLEAAYTELDELLDPDDGWELERKDTSLAVHHRRVSSDTAHAQLARVTDTFERHRDDPPGFVVLRGHAVLELRPTAVDKGGALRRLSDDADGRRPLMLGDDVTDEDAYVVAAATGGIGVLVARQARPSAARWRLTDPTAVVALLAAMAAD